MESNNAIEIKKFFKGRPDAFKLFVAVRKMIERIGDPKIEVGKTQVSFGEKYKYAWIWLPQTWIKNRPEHCIALTIITDKKIVSHIIEESVQPKKGYWTHHIIIESLNDIDVEVEALLKKSYAFYKKRLARK